MVSKLMRYHDIILKNIIQVVGNDSTYSDDLSAVGSYLIGNRFKGVFPSDKIPKLDKKDSAIINIDKSYQPGSHWLGVYMDDEGVFWTYDSFGRDMNKFIPIKTKNTDRDAEQAISENNCGARALSWVYFTNEFGIKYGKLI